MTEYDNSVDLIMKIERPEKSGVYKKFLLPLCPSSSLTVSHPYKNKKIIISFFYKK